MPQPERNRVSWTSRPHAHRRISGGITLLALSVTALLTTGPADARTRSLKFGTVAPKGTVWAKSLDEMDAAFAKESDGAIRVKGYAGVVGDEPTIVRKIRVGQLDGAVLTSAGLSLISRAPMVMQLPMIFDSYAELDAVRTAMEPELNRAMEEQGFVVLAWGEAGWFHFFTKRPAAGPTDIKGMKMWMWAHDPDGVRVFQAIGFEPVVLSSIDMVPSLQTGMIESFPASPMAALALQAYAYAPNMIAVNWTPVIGATVISKRAWDSLPEDVKPLLLKACADIGVRFRQSVRIQSEEAVAAMQKRGLVVHTPSAAQLQAWRKHAEHTREMIRGHALEAALVDRVMQLRDEVRAGSASKPGQK